MIDLFFALLYPKMSPIRNIEVSEYLSKLILKNPIHLYSNMGSIGYTLGLYLFFPNN